MNNKTHEKMLVSGIVATLVFLPGCTDMFKGRGDQISSETRSLQESKTPLTGEVLVTMKGTPVITTDSLERYKENFFKADPQMKQALALVDSKELDRNILDGLIGDTIITEYITSNKINETAAYKAKLQDLFNLMERNLNVEFFRERKAVAVSESEVRAFYDANKDKIQGLTISQGGIAAAGIEFADGAAAHAFASKAKTTPGGFKKVAQDDGLTPKIRDFKLVNNQSIGIDEQLRSKITAIKTIPSIEVFDVNGKFWVVNVTAKEEPKYVPYEQIRDRLKEQLEHNRSVEVLLKEVEALRKEYEIEVNEDYFKAPEMPQQQAALPTSGMPSVSDKKEVVEKRLA